jgi:hypothetical protein
MLAEQKNPHGILENKNKNKNGEYGFVMLSTNHWRGCLIIHL